MRNRKPPNQEEIQRWLKKGPLSLTPLRLRLVSASSQQAGNRKWDRRLEADWDGQSARFAVEYKTRSTPKAFDEALRQCTRQSPDTQELPLILMPYLRTTQLEELARAGVSGIDLCGNGVVIVPGRLLVFRTGAPNQFVSNSPIKNVYRKNTSMVARVLLTGASFAGVRAIQKGVHSRDVLANTINLTPLSLGTVSKALKQLENDLILDPVEKTKLLQGDKLLDLLSRSYEPPAGRRLRLKVDCAFENLPSYVTSRINVSAAPVVATGLASTSRYATMQRDEILSIYCPDIDAARACLDGREGDRFSNIELIETREQAMYFDARSTNAFYWASPVQCYLELMSGDKRDRETADQVRDYILSRVGHDL